MLNICKVGLNYNLMNGINVRSITHCIRIFESMCKSYRTAEIVLYNSDGQVNELGLAIGSPVSFEIQNGTGGMYQMDSLVIGIPEQFSTDGIRKDQVTVVTATSAYMKDRGSLVQHSFVNQTITSAIQTIHNQYVGGPLTTVMESKGMIAKDIIGSYIVSNDKPFKAIRDMANRATYGGVSTGATMYFENKTGHVLGPLESFFSPIKVTAELIQKDTWGNYWRDLFAGSDTQSEKAIIASKLYQKEVDPETAGGGGGGGSGAALASAAQGKTVYDAAKRDHVVDRAAIQIGMISPYLAPFVGKYGGRQITHIMDSARNDLAVDPSTKTEAENAFSARVKNGTNFLVKFTIDSGFKTTVGEGVNVILMAPLRGPIATISGDLLNADLMHECYFDNREVMGTTTIRGVKLSDWPVDNLGAPPNNDRSFSPISSYGHFVY